MHFQNLVCFSHDAIVSKYSTTSRATNKVFGVNGSQSSRAYPIRSDRIDHGNSVDLSQNTLSDQPDLLRREWPL